MFTNCYTDVPWRHSDPDNQDIIDRANVGRATFYALVVVGALIFVSARGEEKPHGQFSPPSPITITFSQGGASTNNNSSSVIVEAYWSQPTLEDLKPPTRVVIQPTALSPHKAKR